MGEAFIRGIQGMNPDDLSSPDHAAATVKHFIGYGFPKAGKDRTPAWISERHLRRYFLPAFKRGRFL